MVQRPSDQSASSRRLHRAWLQTAFGLVHYQTATEHRHGSEHLRQSDDLQDDTPDQECNNPEPREGDEQT